MSTLRLRPDPLAATSIHPADLTRALRAGNRRRRAAAAAAQHDRIMTVPPACSMPAWGRSTIAPIAR